MIITQEQEDMLKEYIPCVHDYVKQGLLVELELAIDEQITEIGMDADFELNQTGILLQKVYDDIYYQNKA